LSGIGLHRGGLSAGAKVKDFLKAGSANSSGWQKRRIAKRTEREGCAIRAAVATEEAPTSTGTSNGEQLRLAEGTYWYFYLVITFFGLFW
jgi:hypothetical protein